MKYEVTAIKIIKIKVNFKNKNKNKNAKKSSGLTKKEMNKIIQKINNFKRKGQIKILTIDPIENEKEK